MVACFDADWAREDFSPHAESHADLVPEQRPRADRRVHRRGEALALAAERALPGHGDHRAPGARGAARREGPHPGAAAAHAQDGQAGRRRRRAADHAGRRRQGAHAEAPEAPRQDDARRRQARDRRIDQPRAGQLRCAARARDRNRRASRGRAAREDRADDWDISHKLDLSDAGLLADLAKRNAEGAGADKLVLDSGKEKKHKAKHR